MLSKQHFMFVEYNGVPYPLGYKSEVCEVAGHFDKNEIEVKEVYSLHTEYSYGRRKFNSELISQFPVLVEANKNGIPQLWKSIEWADSFAEFIILLTKNKTSPRIIEIHPPFNDYCIMNDFLERYSVFEKRLCIPFMCLCSSSA